MDTLFTVVATIILGLLLVLVLHFTDQPEVVVSWETKQCLRVINIDGTEGDCNHLPDKYELIWGK